MNDEIYYKDVPIGGVMRRRDAYFLKIPTVISLSGAEVNTLVLIPGSSPILYKMDLLKLNPMSTLDEIYNQLTVSKPATTALYESCEDNQ